VGEIRPSGEGFGARLLSVTEGGSVKHIWPNCPLCPHHCPISSKGDVGGGRRGSWTADLKKALPAN